MFILADKKTQKPDYAQKNRQLKYHKKAILKLESDEKIKMKGNDTMSFKEMSEADKHFALILLLNRRLNVEYYNERDIQELIEYLIENVERRLGVKIKFQIMKEVSDNRKFCNKTRKEKRGILELIKQGLNNSQIERLTGVSRRTIANIRRNST